MTERSSRLFLGGVLPAIALLAAFIPYFIYRSELPDRLASHFNGSGTPDGSMTVGGFILTTGVMMGVGFVFLIGLALYRKPQPEFAGPVFGFLGGFLAGLGAGILGATLSAKRVLTAGKTQQVPGP